MSAHAQGSNGRFNPDFKAAHRHALSENAATRENCAKPKEQIAGAAAEAYAHVLSSAHEAVGRYLDFSDCMECRGDVVTAQLFRELSQRKYRHAAALSQQASGTDPLPSRPSLHSWMSDGVIARSSYEIVLHFMTPWSALNIALAAQASAKSFFEGLAGSSQHPLARALAAEAALEAGEHVRELEAALQKAPRPVVSEEDMERFLLH